MRDRNAANEAAPVKTEKRHDARGAFWGR